MSDVYNNLNLVFPLIIKPLNCSCNHVYSYHAHMYFIVMCFFCNCCLPLLNQLLLIPYKQLNLLPFLLVLSEHITIQTGNVFQNMLIVVHNRYCIKRFRAC